MIKKPTLAFIAISTGLLISSAVTAASNNDPLNPNANTSSNVPSNVPSGEPSVLQPMNQEADPAAANNNDGSLNKETQALVESQPQEEPGTEQHLNDPKDQGKKTPSEKPNEINNLNISEKLKALTKNSGKKRSANSEPTKDAGR